MSSKNYVVQWKNKDYEEDIIINTRFLNREFWKKKEGEDGYFFYKKESGFMNTYSLKVMDKYWCISSHTSVSYPTLVYFKKRERL